MTDRKKWEARYDTQDYIHGNGPSAYLYSNREYLPRSGSALDLAAGEGRNSVFLAEAGLEVFALDFSLHAIRKCLRLARRRSCRVHAAVVDLNDFEIPRSGFDLVINFNYLQRSLSGPIIRALRPGGLLVFETLTIDHLRWRPDFSPELLLNRGELPGIFRGLHIIKYREATIRSGERPRSVASLIAKKP